MTELSEILAKDRATRYLSTGPIEMVIMEEGNLDSMMPLEAAINAYIAEERRKQVEQYHSWCGCPMCEYHSSAYSMEQTQKADQQRKRAGL